MQTTLGNNKPKQPTEYNRNVCLLLLASGLIVDYNKYNITSK